MKHNEIAETNNFVANLVEEKDILTEQKIAPVVVVMRLNHEGSDLTGEHEFTNINKAISWLKKEYKQAQKDIVDDMSEASFNTPKNQMSAVIIKNNATNKKMPLDFAVAKSQDKKDKRLVYITPNTKIRDNRKISSLKVGEKVAIEFRKTSRGLEATIVAFN